MKNFVGSMGANSYFSYPCELQGTGFKSINIGRNTGIQKHTILGCWNKFYEQNFNPAIFIGNNCNIGEYTHISSCNRITIGDGLLTGRFVLITDNNHGALSKEESTTPPLRRKLVSKGEIVIGENVWIGDKVTILGGVNVGNNVIIAANSVVTKSIPDNCVAAGNPAKIIKSI